MIFYIYFPLCVLILSFCLFYSRHDFYRPCSPELINTSYERQDYKDNSQWQYSKNVEWDNQGGYSGEGEIRLGANEMGGSYITRTIGNSREWRYLKFSGRMRTEDVVKGDKPWSKARLLLYFKDAKGNSLWEHPHVLCSLYGDNEWREYTRIFPVPENAVTAHVVAQNAGYSGSAWFDELSVVGAAREKSFLWINITAGLIWIAVLILLVHVTGIWALPYNRVIMGLIVLIVIGVALPQPLINSLAQKSKVLNISALRETDQKPLLKSVGPVTENKSNDPFLGYKSESLIGIIKGVGHFTLFALTCFFLNLAYREKNKAKSETFAERYKSCNIVIPAEAGIQENTIRKHLDSPVKPGNDGVGLWIPPASVMPGQAYRACPVLDTGSGMTEKGLIQRSQSNRKTTGMVPVISIGFGLVLFAGATEVLQFVSETRGPSIHDWLIDVAGIVAGAVGYVILKAESSKLNAQS